MGRLKDVIRRMHAPKQFDHRHIITMGADNGGWVWYQTLPACMHGHRVDVVYHYARIAVDTEVKLWSGNFHCLDCGIMGSTETLKSYICK